MEIDGVTCKGELHTNGLIVEDVHLLGSITIFDIEIQIAH